MSRQINLSVIEDNPAQMPEEIERMGKEAIQIIWQTSRNIAQQEIEQIKKRYQKYETEVLQQRQEALNKVNEVNNEIAVAKGIIESLKRENKSLGVDLSNKISELKSAEDQVALFKEKAAEQEHEIKHLMEEIGRLRENVDVLKKRLYETERKAEQDRTNLREAQEELAVNLNNRERLEKDLKASQQESNKVWKQLKVEQRRAAVADALVQEMKETNQKYESEIKQLKEEKHETRESLQTESKARVELEKKVALFSGRADSQEASYKEMLSRLEHQFEKAQNEASQLRNRLIKAEAALEREKKAVERLETKLIATSETKM
jgi:chromosome segregation ATPase